MSVDQHRVPCIARERGEKGWRYEVQEHSFLVWAAGLFHDVIGEVDDLIENLWTQDGKHIYLPGKRRAELLDMRASAMEAHQRGNTELAHERLLHLINVCRWTREQIFATPMVREKETRDRTKKGGRKPLDLSDVKIAAVLNAIGKGISYKKIEADHKISAAKISALVKPLGGASSVRREYLRKQRRR